MIFGFVILFLIAALISAFLYHPRKSPGLFILRTFAVWFFLLFIWNPSFKHQTKKHILPQLFLVADHSLSMKKDSVTIEKWIKDFLENNDLKKKFNLQVFYADTSLHEEKPRQWTPQTDLARVLEEVKDKKHTNQKVAVVLLTDGRSTRGKDFRYVLSPADRLKVFPVVPGDTNVYPDLFIERVDFNKTVNKDNFFPVRIHLGIKNSRKPVLTRLEVLSGSQTLFAKNIRLTPAKPFMTLSRYFRETRPGFKKYSIRLRPVEGEKNLKNNRKTIQFEVADHKAEILLLTGKIHPDAGLFRRILSRNESYHLQTAKKFTGRGKYNLVIVFQPTAQTLGFLENYKGPVFWITGKFTDWNALNKRQSYFKKHLSVHAREQFFPVPNPAFHLFEIPAVPVRIMPPLEDVFGEVELLRPAEVPYFARIKNVTTSQPLAAVFPEERQAAIFGDGLWRWYLYEKKYQGDTKHITGWIEKTVRFLLNRPGKNLLRLEYKNRYDLQRPVEIRIRAFNPAGEFNRQARLSFVLKGPGKKKQKIPLFFRDGYFVARPGNLTEGTYTFSVYYPAYKLSRTGRFEVYKPEPEAVSLPADVSKLRTLADETGGKLYAPDKGQELIASLMKSKDFPVIFEVQEKQSPLTDRWWWLLAAVLLLAVEWFYRKSRGLI